jgi:hypothetical protein
MTAVMVEITPKPEAATLDPDAIILVSDVETLAEGTLPGCGDDNPYN